MALNKVMLIGNVGKKPEIRYLDNQGSQPNPPKIASFPLATSERFRDRSGEIRENTEWHNIVAWRQLADLAENYITTGTQIYVEGRLRSRSWDGQDGQKRYITEIVADSIQLLGKKSDNPGAQAAGSQPAQATAPAQPGQRAYAPYSTQAAAPSYAAPAPVQAAAPAPAPAQPIQAAAQAQPAPAPAGVDDSDDLPF